MDVSTYRRAKWLLNDIAHEAVVSIGLLGNLDQFVGSGIRVIFGVSVFPLGLLFIIIIRCY